MFLKSLHTWAIALLGCLASCAIENDIPYPIIDGNIEEMVVEGMRGEKSGDPAEAVINKNALTVTLYVNDSVDISRLKITKLKISPEAELLPDSAACVNYEKFPKRGFASLDSIPLSSNTRMDFSKPVNFTLRTYQDYVWQVTVKQIVDRKIEVAGMIRTVVDPSTRNAIIYVGSDQDLSNVQISALNLGGAYGSVKPDPSTVHDFSNGPQTFYVSYNGEDYAREWKVFVYHDEEGGSGASASTTVMATKATVRGNIQSGKTPVVEYKKSGEANWQTVPASEINVSGTTFTAVLSGLTPGATYSYRVSIDGAAGSEQSFTTAQAIALTNGSFEEWSKDPEVSKQWNPWKLGNNSFWGTGNKGAAKYSDNVTEPTDESVSGKAALLAARFIFIKFAAGNLFTGDFDLNGMNGILTLGRDFNSFPSALRVHLKYKSSTINKVEDPYTYLKGQADMCHVYIALSTEKVIINTANKDAFDKKGSSIIAYGEFISDKDVSGNERNGYKQIDIPLEYYKTDVTPKYIIIVCTSSRYGDFFTGGEESKLWLDEMELLYE